MCFLPGKKQESILIVVEKLFSYRRFSDASIDKMNTIEKLFHIQPEKDKTMTVYEQYSAQYNKLWQERIVKTNYIAATVIFGFEIAYYFLLTAAGLRDQSSLEYILRFILLPGGVIFITCIISGYIVYKTRRSSMTKSLLAMLTMVMICTVAASVHNIFATTLCSFFVPLAISVVFGKRRITNIVGACCVAGELVAMYCASMDLRGRDPYFLLDCMMLFIVFGISWYTTLLLMRNEQEKRHVIDHMQKEKNVLQQKICRDELTGLYNLLGLQLFVDSKISEENRAYEKSSVIFLDIDDFKQVNDTFGHEVGNITLIYISDCIHKHFSQNSCIARYGGDEFVVLLPGVPAKECSALLKHLMKKIEALPITELGNSTVSVSCGIASYDFCAPILDAINLSDQAMYRAKAQGKNCSVMA